jgi:hypothetical protein
MIFHVFLGGRTLNIENNIGRVLQLSVIHKGKIKTCKYYASKVHFITQNPFNRGDDWVEMT